MRPVTSTGSISLLVTASLALRDITPYRCGGTRARSAIRYPVGSLVFPNSGEVADDRRVYASKAMAHAHALFISGETMATQTLTNQVPPSSVTPNGDDHDSRITLTRPVYGRRCTKKERRCMRQESPVTHGDYT